MSVLSDTKLQCDTLRNNADTALPTNLLPVTASTFCSWNGTGTPAVLESFNTSSITDRGVGEFTLNLTSALDSSDYCAVTGILDTGTSTITQMEIEVRATSSLQVGTRFTNGGAGTAFDSIYNCVVIFGGQ